MIKVKCPNCLKEHFFRKRIEEIKCDCGCRIIKILDQYWITLKGR